MKAEELNKLLDHVRRPICKIEEDLGMPKTTLQKAVKGERTLPKKWAISLKEYVGIGGWISANSKDGGKTDTTSQETGQNSTQTEKTGIVPPKKKEPKNEEKASEMPDPKKDRAAWAKWMRENKQ